jgi:RNA polymerase sigma-70 factor (ECF subfamily)
MTEAVDEQEHQVAATLVARTLDGDPEAETDIVRRYQRGLRFLLRRKTRDPDLADDLLQETWVTAFAKLRSDGIDDPRKLAGYLAGIAKNLALGDQRKTQRRQTSPNTDYLDRVADDAPGVCDELSRAQVCTYVRKLLNELTVERDREILLRFYVQEEEKDRICDDLEIDSTHFNRVLFRAKQRFRDIILRAQRRDKFQVIES